MIQYCDSFIFLRILKNLLSNSIKFTNNVSINITLKCIKWNYSIKHIKNGSSLNSLSSSDDIFALQFNVEDTGTGMKEEQTKDIKKHIQTGEMMAVYENGCVGVGLSLASELVRLVNGKIEVQSMVGKGTKFTITTR